MRIADCARWENRWLVDGTLVHQVWIGPAVRGSEFRGWDASAGRWTGHNRYSNGQWRTTVADYVDGEMIVQIVDARDQNGPFINRETYFDIGPDRFSMKSERSYDGGRTFVKGAYSMVCNRR